MRRHLFVVLSLLLLADAAWGQETRLAAGEKRRG
jgi:hypothetical protein